MKKEKHKYDNKICAVTNHSELERIRDFIKSNAQSFGFDEMDSNKIALAVDEACTNLINHAFKLSPDHEICIQVDTQIKDFIITISDDAESFNPLEKNQPDMVEYFHKYKKGGLGIHIMRLVMDEIQYLPSSSINPKNILKLKKQLH
jgi:serine/threonine-protein kinase RsbW